MRTGERGFTLLEVVVCAGILALVSAASLGAFAAIARNAAPPAARDLALAAADNALARARAAVAYASSPTLDGTALLANRTWALVPGTTSALAGGELDAPAACGRTARQPLRLPLTATYDPATERFTVVVGYPRDPCRVGADGTIPSDDLATVRRSAILPPSVYPPGQTVTREVAPPARM
ncbi:MAG TPA: prepilin-type N-terminal cleavage/methylation domain-containing protein [Candidatus Elarobacter sp.]